MRSSARSRSPKWFPSATWCSTSASPARSSTAQVDAAFSALEELSLFARQRGVEILLENIPNELSSAERLLQFEELTHLGLELSSSTPATPTWAKAWRRPST